ncbi:hypothetical protein ACHHYP_01520 [Achlya hypogyna]|uniref:Uncharacterized protein n=1 Tax=Achlya hypogyna TaxID=1202772 RepID=A0A1V9Z8M6_ACHHY|nr:hypothetical protein ACHHYP_01520 [Achlya hypogyna]
MGPCASKDRRLDQWATDGNAEDKIEEDKPDKLLLHREDTPATSVVHLSPTHSSLLASAWDDGRIEIVDWSSREAVASIPAHKKAINRLAFGPNTKSLYACSRDTTISRYRLDFDGAVNTVKMESFAGHSLSVSAITINGSETQLASGSRDTSVSLWDVATTTQLQHTTTSQNIVTCMAWVPIHDTLVAQGGEDLRVRIWDSRAWKSPVQTIEGYVYFPLSLDVSDDGNYILTSSKGTILSWICWLMPLGFNGVGCEGRVWDRRTGKQVCEMAGHLQDATACSYIKQRNEYVLTASKDSSLRVWNSASGALVSSTYDHALGMFTALTSLPPDDAGIVRIFTSSFTGHLAVYAFNTATATIELEI